MPKTAAYSFSVPAPMMSSGRRGYEDEADEAPVKRWTRAEVEALRSRQPSLSPWRVVGAQVVLALVIAAIAGVATGSRATAVSALYGAAVVAVPGALMARGTTSPLSRLSPATSAIGVMFWAMVKIGASVAMLVVAPKVVPGLHWPAMLIAMVVCMQTYWLALLWRGRSKN